MRIIYLTYASSRPDCDILLAYHAHLRLIMEAADNSKYVILISIYVLMGYIKNYGIQRDKNQTWSHAKNNEQPGHRGSMLSVYIICYLESIVVRKRV